VAKDQIIDRTLLDPEMNFPDEAKDWVMATCRSAGAQFSVISVIQKLSASRPDLLHEFNDAWDRLVRERKVRISRAGEPCLYEVSQGEVG
jgi:hypothetical protein